MCDVIAMAEAERGDELLEVAACSGLREAAMTGDLGEKLAAAGEVDDEVDLGPRARDLIDEEDVRVVVEVAHDVARSVA